MPSVLDQFKEQFSEENLLEVFENNLQGKGPSGVDGVRPDQFLEKHRDQIGVISKKVDSGEYKFTRYKMRLVSKGESKPPRIISIPTVRDRLVLRALCDFLVLRFKSALDLPLPQDVIREVKSEIVSGDFDTVIKLDISNFFPSVRHDELERRLNKRIKHSKIVRLILKALETPTTKPHESKAEGNRQGIPQGLSISNILSAMYLLNIDRYMKGKTSVGYHRFVDDILVFCKSSDYEFYLNTLRKKFKKIGLEVHDPRTAPEKSTVTSVNGRFDYLGYSFEQGKISVRSSSINKIKDSLASIFTGYKYSRGRSVNFLIWRLNLRITGCIYENKCKGWLFFFSEINDESLLHVLDNYVKKLCSRFSVNQKPKRFARAFKEIQYRKYKTNYIPKFDNLTIDEMKDIIFFAHGLKAYEYTPEEVYRAFRIFVHREIKELEEDVQDFS